MDWHKRIEAAAARIEGHVRRTPVTHLAIPGLPDIEVKLEQMQHTGTFKARGAFNALVSGPVPAGGVVAASGGNHGAAVAYAAAQLGIAAHIFVPEIAGPSKIALIRRSGAELTVVPGTFAEAVEAPPGLLEALGLNTALWIGRSKFDYLVQVEAEDTVRSLSPDHTRLKSLPVRGVMVTAAGRD